MTPLTEARRAQTSSARLAALAESDDPAVREAVARHRNTPAEALGRLLPFVPEVVFAHPRLAEGRGWSWDEAVWLEVAAAPDPPGWLVARAARGEVGAAAIARARGDLNRAWLEGCRPFARGQSLAAKLERARACVAERLGPARVADPDELVAEAVLALALRFPAALSCAAAALVVPWLTPTHLVRLARVATDDLAVAITAHPSATAEPFRVVAARFPTVRRELHASEHATAPFLLDADPRGEDLRVLRALLERGEGHAVWVARATQRGLRVYEGVSPLDPLAGAPNVEAVLEELVAHASTREAVAAFRGAVSAGLQDRLAGDERAEVRATLAKRSDLCATVARRLVEDPEPRVRAALAANAVAPWEIVAPLWDDPAPAVRAACRGRGDAPVGWLSRVDGASTAELLGMLNHPGVPPEVLSRLVRHPEPAVVRAAVGHPSFQPWDLDVSLTHPDEEVRRLVAALPALPIGALRELAQDPEPRVRHTLLAREDLPEDVLLQLCFDPSVRIRVAVARRRATPSALRDLLLDDENARVREAAARGR